MTPSANTQKTFRQRNYRTSPSRIAYAERVQKAIQMRKENKEYSEIAAALGWNSQQAAQDAVKRHLDRAVLDDARSVKLMRLLLLLACFAPPIKAPRRGRGKLEQDDLNP